MYGMCFGERVKVEVYRVGVRGEVGQYNSMYVYMHLYMGLKKGKKIGFNRGNRGLRVVS